MTIKVLIVEDNEMNLDMLSRRLVKKNYEVVTAGNGELGVQKAIDEQPDVILMDMSLPIMDGWTAVSHIKKNEATKHIPIIALTAHAMSGDREKALDAGCDDYDVKPIDFPSLLLKIEKWAKTDGL